VRRYLKTIKSVEMAKEIDEVNIGNVVEIPVGKVEDSAIERIQEGTSEEFRNSKYWESAEGSKAEIAAQKKAPAIEITTANGARLVMNLPQKEEMHPKMTLAIFKRRYGSFPKKSLKVSTQIDANGFWQIVL
jgi:hypothetical protein